MANYDNPNGFTPISAGVVPTHLYTASAACKRGDLAALVGGQVLPYAIGTHDEAVGVFAQDIASGASGLVWDDPATIFRGQTSGSYAATTHDGVAVDVEGTTGIMEVNEDATVKRVVRILRHSPVAGSVDTGANARVAFLIARHALSAKPDDNLTQATAAAGGKVELYEATDNGTSKVTMQAPASLTADRTITLGDEDIDLPAIKAKAALLTAASAAAAAKLELAEDTDNGTNKYTVQAPASLTADRTCTLPDADLDFSSWPASAAKLAMLTAADATAAAKIDLAEDTDNGANKLTIQAPASLAADRTVTFGDDSYDMAAIKAQAAAITVASASAAGKLELGEDTDNGANKLILQAPAALGADRTVSFPDANVDLTDVGTHTTQIAALGAENTDGHMMIPLGGGDPDAGTWTLAIASGIPVLTRTASADAQSYWREVPIAARTTASKGIKPTGMRVKYSVNTALVDDVRIELWKLTQGADNAAPTAAVIFGDADGDYDADHNTAAKRSDNVGAPEEHLAVLTDAAGAAYLGAGEQLVLRLFVDGDAGAAGVVAFKSVDLLYSETQVDLT